jgi:alpha-N-arabinofuranosidase
MSTRYPLKFVLLVIALIAFCCNSASTGKGPPASKLVNRVPEKITVDASRVLNDTRRRQIGINTCFLTDDDKSYLRSPKRPFNEALKELNPAYLRYPGGWKSDVVLWSVPPYTKSQPTLARPHAASFPANDRTLVNPDGSWRIDPYDFDEFMSTCRAVGAEPVLVVCYNSYRWSLDFDKTPNPTRRQIIDTAVEWVRYANKVKGYNVKYWEIGNESWLPMKENGKTSTIPPEIYAEDVAEMSQRMKQVDPAILIGANALKTDDWITILNKAAEHIDFLVVHPYPFYGWKGYDAYLRHDPDALYCVRFAKEAIKANEIASRKQLKIMATEFAAGTFDKWDRSGADVARGVMTVDILGQLLRSPDCYMCLFWNTINVYEGDGSVFNALMRDNTLSAVGRALTIWGRFLEDEMVETSTAEESKDLKDAGNPSMVRCYASRTDSKLLNVILVNKDIKATPIELKLRQASLTDTQGEKWVYKGTSPTDKNPTWGKVGWIKAAGGTLETALDPVSVTVFSFSLRPNSGLEKK